ncbi:MAG: biotin transporter BioY [Endomicrobiia bacterium]
MITHLTYSRYLSQNILKISTPLQKFIYIIFISLFGSFLLAVSSKINFVLPFTFVPFTMQTFVVLLLSMMFGREVIYILISYVFEGIVGLPVFAKGGGVLYILGPTGGYIVGFLISGYICGLLAEAGFTKSFLKTISVMILGILIIYFCGALWLLRFVNFSIKQALKIGVLPFIIGDLIKIIFVSFVLPLSYKRINN